MRCLIFSQCSVFRIGVMWTNFGVLLTALASAFWITCSRPICIEASLFASWWPIKRLFDLSVWFQTGSFVLPLNTGPLGTSCWSLSQADEHQITFVFEWVELHIARHHPNINIVNTNWNPIRMILKSAVKAALPTSACFICRSQTSPCSWLKFKRLQLNLNSLNTEIIGVCNKPSPEHSSCVCTVSRQRYSAVSLRPWYLHRHRPEHKYTRTADRAVVFRLTSSFATD